MGVAMTSAQALPLLRAEIASMEAEGQPFRPEEWAIVVCDCTQAEGFLLAAELGTRLAHGPAVYPCGSFLLKRLPEAVQ